MLAITYIKYAGLFFSAILTIRLFIRLFPENYLGWIMGLVALIMFEGGTAAWELVLPLAKSRQRLLAKMCLVVCISASILSSGSEIVLSTELWQPPFDIEFWTLVVIIGSLAANVIGGIGYYLLDPEVEQRNTKLDREAKVLARERDFENRVVDRSLDKAEEMVEKISDGVAEKIATEVKDDVVQHLLEKTRGGANSLPAPTHFSSRPRFERPAYQPSLPMASAPAPVKISTDSISDRRNGSQPEEDTKNRGKSDWKETELD